MPKNHYKSLFTKANVIVFILIALFVIATFAIFFVNIVPSANSDNYLIAVVHDADGKSYELDLNMDDTLTVKTELGENTIAIENGEAYMLAADCEGQDCIHQGSISSSGQQIICLPHKLWVEIVAKGEESAGMDTGAVPNSSNQDESNGFDTISR